MNNIIWFGTIIQSQAIFLFLVFLLLILVWCCSSKKIKSSRFLSACPCSFLSILCKIAACIPIPWTYYQLHFLDIQGCSSAGSSNSRLINHFVGMGFTEESVLKAIQENGICIVTSCQ